MVDFISREEAKAILHKRTMETAMNNAGYQCDAGVVFQDASHRLKVWLDGVPAADVRPVVRGAWKPNPRNPYWLDCTVCGYGKPERTVYNFCPNCGADMREGGED